jgi:hypothetical protein
MKTDDQVAGGPRGPSLSPDSGKVFLFSTEPRPVLGPTQPPIQCVPEAIFAGGKAAGTWS